MVVGPGRLSWHTPRARVEQRGSPGQARGVGPSQQGKGWLNQPWDGRSHPERGTLGNKQRDMASSLPPHRGIQYEYRNWAGRETQTTYPSPFSNMADPGRKAHEPSLRRSPSSASLPTPPPPPYDEKLNPEVQSPCGELKVLHDLSHASLRHPGKPRSGV